MKGGRWRRGGGVEDTGRMRGDGVFKGEGVERRAFSLSYTLSLAHTLIAVSAAEVCSCCELPLALEWRPARPHHTVDPKKYR